IGRGQVHDMESFKEVERWRDELAAGNDAIMDEILGRFQGADRQKLHQLVLNARKEQEIDKPPRATRALFRFLKALSEQR
ncbi:MAG: DUF615 domain-containing protein, partial [Syntrophobacteraceae bacterium]